MSNWLKNQLTEIDDPKRKQMVSRALDFGKQNSNALVIICNPKTDEVAITYNKKYSVAKFMLNIPLLKIKKGVIKKILYSKDTKEKDENIYQLMMVMGGFIARATGKFKEDKIGDPKDNAEKQAEELNPKVAE